MFTWRALGRSTLLVGALVAIATPASGVGAGTRVAGKWEIVPTAENGLGPGARVESITTGGPGLVAVGRVFTAQGPTQAAWTSTNGRRWRRVTSSTFGLGDLGPVVATPVGLFAFASPDSRTPSTVWHSRDGRSWNVRTTAAPTGIRHAIAGGPGLIAGGFETEGDSATTLRSALWTSTDGVDWTRVEGGDDVFPLGYVSGISPRRDGALAVGVEQAAPGGPGAPSHPVIWFSDDGVRWRRQRGDLGFGHAILSIAAPLVAQRDRFTLLGSAESSRPAPPTTTTPPTTSARPGRVRICATSTGYPAVFSSATGRKWVQLTREGELPDATYLTGARDWFVAAGSSGTCETTRAVTYVSRDGEHWQRGYEDSEADVAPGAVRYPQVLAPTRSGALVIVGELGSDLGSGPGPDVWLWTAPR